ncbi:hypothetical protein KK062_17100 [Fulvivirgaceae bacterium PWU5]|uniref:Uncharacterized protein n=1 Tax=Dawidia cretensis TaxID=2782350 RepID=A0AAP2DZ35_9BACT|nr:hypothetical protein [Dawidia cretensis]
MNNVGYGLLSAVEEAADEEVRKNYDANVFGLLNVTCTAYASSMPDISLTSHPSRGVSGYEE